jgi:hypothetical protein
MENQKSIEFEEYSHAPSLIQEKISNVKSSAINWLDSKSEFYSRIADFKVTHRQAIRIGVILPLLMIVAGIAVVEQPIVACVAGFVSAWIVYRLNHSQKGGRK